MKALVFLTSTLLLWVTLALSNPALATSSLSFEGGGYWIDMEIGDYGHPVIAGIRFHSPGDKKGVVLSKKLVTVTAFDPKQRRLSLRYAGGSGVAPFVLSVRGAAARLDVGVHRVFADFNWGM